MSDAATVYVIKIIGVSKPSMWYSKRQGETYEAILEKRGGVQMYKIAALTYFYVYPKDAEVIEVKKIPKYTRF